MLKAVISQRLVPRADGKGRVAAVEVLKATARVRELIEDKDRTKEIPDAIAQGHQSYGMQTFDQSLMSLVRQNVITYEEAHRQATNPDDFALRFSGISATSDARWDDFEGTPGDGSTAPGSVAFAQRGGPASPPPAQQSSAAVGRMSPPSAARPAAAPAAPRPPASGAQSTGLPSADDDFHIERF